MGRRARTPPIRVRPPRPPAIRPRPSTCVSATGVVDNVMAGYIEESVRARPRRFVAGDHRHAQHAGWQPRRHAADRVRACSRRRCRRSCGCRPSGGRAASAGTFITLSANLAYMAPGTNIGAASPVGSGGEDLTGTIGEKVRNDAIANIRSIAEARGRNVDWAVSTVEKRGLVAGIGGRRRSGAVDGIATSLEDVRRQADGQVVDVRGAPVTVDIADAPFVDLADEPVPVDHPPAVGPERRVHPADARLLRAALRAPEPQLRDRHPRRDRAHPRVHRLRQPAAQRRRRSCSSDSRSSCSCSSSR